MVARRIPTTDARTDRILTQTKVAAKNKESFLADCRWVAETGQRIFVMDKSRKTFMTLDARERYLPDPVLDMAGQFFKDNYSRCSSLIRTGLAFRLTIRNSNAAVYARRHQKYTDPCDTVIEAWRDKVTESALSRHHNQEKRLLELFKQFSPQNEEEIVEILKSIKLGVARLAIGHRPFEEGQI